MGCPDYPESQSPYADLLQPRHFVKANIDFNLSTKLSKLSNLNIATVSTNKHFDYHFSNSFSRNFFCSCLPIFACSNDVWDGHNTTKKIRELQLGLGDTDMHSCPSASCLTRQTKNIKFYSEASLLILSLQHLEQSRFKLLSLEHISWQRGSGLSNISLEQLTSDIWHLIKINFSFTEKLWENIRRPSDLISKGFYSKRWTHIKHFLTTS